MTEKFSKAEIRKDAIQDAVQATASTVGEVAGILTTAVRDLAGAVGSLASEVFEIREGTRRALDDADD